MGDPNSSHATYEWVYTFLIVPAGLALKYVYDLIFAQSKIVDQRANALLDRLEKEIAEKDKKLAKLEVKITELHDQLDEERHENDKLHDTIRELRAMVASGSVSFVEDAQ